MGTSYVGNQRSTLYFRFRTYELGIVRFGYLHAQFGNSPKSSGSANRVTGLGNRIRFDWRFWSKVEKSTPFDIGSVHKDRLLVEPGEPDERRHVLIMRVAPVRA